MDRVSNLPDEILVHVLSFLTTKEAALTSILAKRWRNLFALVPDIAIDDSVFLHPEEGKEDREDIIQSFMNFVDRVLALRGDSPVKKVSIKCRSEVDSGRVDSWISNVLERCVSDLDLLISLDEDENYQLSPKCFECSTLVKLKIGCGIDINWDAGRICLPFLKTFVLDAAQVETDKFENLLYAMPALEELVLLDVIWKDMDVTVSSASVKNLTIKLDDRYNSVSFDTPRLVYFQYSGFVASDYPVVNMENVCDAIIILKITEWDLKRAREPVVWLEDDEDRVARGFSNVWKLFHGVRNVRNLRFFPTTLEVLSLCCETMPVFSNLKSLSIESDKDRGWQAMPVLLRKCPHIEVLVIENLVHHETDKCGDACDCISREDKGLSLTSSPLKVLEIQGFRGTMKEMGMIKHFLDYFPCLKEMDIYVAEDGPTQLGNREISKLTSEMFALYNELSSCNVQLLVSDSLAEKWRKNKAIS